MSEDGLLHGGQCVARHFLRAVDDGKAHQRRQYEQRGMTQLAQSRSRVAARFWTFVLLC